MPLSTCGSIGHGLDPECFSDESRGRNLSAFGRSIYQFANKWIGGAKISIKYSFMAIRYNSENKPRGLYFSKALFKRLIFGGAYNTEGNFRVKPPGAFIWRGDLFEGFWG